MQPTLVILAAGMGSRFGGPKQLEPLGPVGETFPDYAIHDALHAGFGDIVLIVRREMRESFEQGVVARWGERVPIRFVHQELEAVPDGFKLPEGRTKPWGTGQAVLAASDAVSGPFGVINADDFYGQEAYGELARFLTSDAGGTPPAYACVGFPLRDTMTEAGTVNRGVMRVSSDGWLERIEEVIGIEKAGNDGHYRDGTGVDRTIPGSTPVSMNMWGFTPEVFDQLDEGFRAFLSAHGDTTRSEYLLPTMIEQLITERRARVRVLQGAGPWCGVTYPDDKPRVAGVLRRLHEQGTYAGSLWG